MKRHDGHIETDCPICEPASRPGYERVRAALGWRDDPPAGAAILCTGGIGDVWAVESMFSVELRERLECVYVACPASAEIALLWNALRGTPAYPRLRNVEVLKTGRRTHYAIASVEAAVGKLPEGVEDWSILNVFPRRLPYTGSTFLLRDLADVEYIPAGSYIVIVAGSSWGRYDGRDFTSADWKATLGLLDREKLQGVVLRREVEPIPRHPRLIDLQGLPSILASVEILKGAVGYVGVDSCLSVLASKLFPAGRLCVKSVSAHCWENRENYFAPRREFPFLRRQVDVSQWG